MSILNGKKDVEPSPIDEVVEDREPLTTASAVLKKEDEKRKEKSKALYNKRASIWAEEKKMLNNFTEEEVDDFLKKNKHRMNEKRTGTLTLSVNIYQYLLTKKSKAIFGSSFPPDFFKYLKKEIDNHEKMKSELEEKN